MKPSRTRAWVITAMVTAFVAYALLLWQGPWWLDGARLRGQTLQPATAMVVTGFRTALVALGAGALAGAGLYYTDRTLRHTRTRDQEQAEIARDGQVTAHYVEAIKLLASERTVERLGGIYALERIMRDSAKDHLSVVEVLAAFVRDKAPSPTGSEPAPAQPLDESVQAALTVIGRRPQAEEPFRLDLRRTDLRGADLRYARLSRARLAGARLSGADLIGARLEDAWLRGTHLDNTWLDRADLSGTFLRDADLRGASLKDTRFDDTRLFAADLSTALHLTAQQLERAVLDSGTKLPPSLGSQHGS
ncbi:pentapeptide repeat-containing protein [Streptomyces sp. NPDC001941]|uniref:pentapeptide repeat-containing protein n=1 Tax=Streptomyces sp. NPDC001941 TaxID=3154659 RepID=UPI0033306FCB